MPKSSPDNSFFGWLGRQVGHVKKAALAPLPQDADAAPKVVYRKDKVEEKEMPNQPGIKLRRTTIDEVIMEPGAEKPGFGNPEAEE